jgi:hypothetical protein
LPQIKWNEAKQGLTWQNDMIACIEDDMPGQKKSTSGQCSEEQKEQNITLTEDKRQEEQTEYPLRGSGEMRT